MPWTSNGKGKQLHTMLSKAREKLRGQAARLKTFFMLNLAEHEILNAHKYKYI